jgi:hypothetical protein
MSVKGYLLSVPERLLRSTVGVAAGILREVGEVAVPKAVRRGHLYQNLVDTTLRFLIERVGGAEGVYQTEEQLADDFLLRRTAGNAVEALGIVAFRASPVWVLAALADVCGGGRALIPEIAEALKAEGLLEKDTQFTTVDQMLDGLERTSSRLAETVNTPPLDVHALRHEWQAIRAEASTIAPGALPTRDSIGALWTELRSEAASQNKSIYELSSTMALSAATAVPEKLRWLGAAAKPAAQRTGQVFASAMLDSYRQTLHDIREVGYATYAGRQLRPYLRAALVQFSPKKRTLTEYLVDRRRSR